MITVAGPGDEDKDAASVRADRPVPFDVSLYYYEVQVVNKGRDGFVGTYTSLALTGSRRFPRQQLCVHGKCALNHATFAAIDARQTCCFVLPATFWKVSCCLLAFQHHPVWSMK